MIDLLSPHTGLELLQVDVANEVVAIPIESVKEVIEYTKITQVPMCHPVFSGVINVRGSVVPVIDAAKRLELDNPNAYDKYSCIILYDSLNAKLQENVTLGLVVSRVRSIQSANSEQLYDKPAFGTHIAPNYIWKMVELDRVTTPILAMSELLNGEQLNALLLASQKQLLTRWEG
ncbi:chemotaxis signal transduction protein [Vibrio sinaloensis DSM 21326]|uniref:Chemotaxis protein CheW n=1 Tax=Vibrio sinaloensis DSM 21326 TaxID=945550 RepID=E8M6H1_PHOS4|nr:chemotaxis protein CheW [Vibrio sinaloensis]EGA70289.1 chemotaxis signal transduction protein [Vibrio sinaloensis DSM 21326]